MNEIKLNCKFLKKLIQGTPTPSIWFKSWCRDQRYYFNNIFIQKVVKTKIKNDFMIY